MSATCPGGRSTGCRKCPTSTSFRSATAARTSCGSAATGRASSRYTTTASSSTRFPTAGFSATGTAPCAPSARTAAGTSMSPRKATGSACCVPTGAGARSTTYPGDWVIIPSTPSPGDSATTCSSGTTAPGSMCFRVPRGASRPSNLSRAPISVRCMRFTAIRRTAACGSGRTATG